MNKIYRFSIKGLIFLFLASSHIGAFGGAFAATLPVKTAEQITIPDTLIFTGTVEAVNSGTASAQTNGRVIKTYFDVGDLVQKDAVMVQLRDTQQKANYEAAQANVEALAAKYQSAEKEYIRISDIYKKRLVSKSVLDNTLAQRDAAKASFEAAKAKLKAAKVQLDYTKVRAPYSGIVLKRHIEVGETVHPGMPLYTGMSLEYMRIIADVPQKDIDAIRQFKQAIVELPSAKQLSIEGDKLTFFGYADPVNATFKVRVNLPAGIKGLYPGMYLKTSFKIGERSTLVIPTSSIIHRGDVTAVYVQTADKLSFRQIVIGSEVDDSLIEVLSGLKVGESVVTEPSIAIELMQSQETRIAGESHE